MDGGAPLSTPQSTNRSTITTRRFLSTEVLKHPDQTCLSLGTSTRMKQTCLRHCATSRREPLVPVASGDKAGVGGNITRKTGFFSGFSELIRPSFTEGLWVRGIRPLILRDKWPLRRASSCCWLLSSPIRLVRARQRWTNTSRGDRGTDRDPAGMCTQAHRDLSTLLRSPRPDSGRKGT